MQYILIIAFIPLFSTVFAQTLLDTTVFQLNEIVITASRTETLLNNTPEAIRVIHTADIALLNPSSVGEVLNNFSGINIESGTGSGLPKRSIVNIKGFPAQYNLVLIDGVRLLSDHIHSGQNVEQVSVDNIDRIELIHGASSAQYGSDALGGIVNLITKSYKNSPELSMNISGSSYRSYSANVTALTPITGGLNNSLFVGYEDSKGVEISAPANRIGKMGYNVFSLMDKLHFSLNDQTQAYANFNLTYNNNQWTDRYYYSYFMAPAAGLNHKFSNSFNVSSKISFLKWKSEQNLELNNLWHPEIVFNYNLKNTSFHFGIDAKHNSFTRTAVSKHSQSSFGGFVQDEFRFSENLTAMAALRFDKVESLSIVVSPKISLLIKPYESYYIRTSVGRGFHAPSVQELYEIGYGHGGRALRFGNENLKPEYSTTIALNNEFYFFPDLMFMVDFYYSKIEDMIVPVYKGAWIENPSKDVWMRENIHKAIIYGAEIFGKMNILRSYWLEAGYTISKNKNEETNLQLPYNPGSSIYLKLSFYENISDNIFLNGFAGFRIVQNRSAWNWKPAAGLEPSNPQGIITNLDDYKKFDLGLTLGFLRNYSVYFNIYNVFGEEIETIDDAYTVYKGEPTFKVGLKYHLSFLPI